MSRLVMVSVAVLISCSDEVTTATEDPAPLPVAPTAVSLLISPKRTVMELGESQSLVAVNLMSNGAYIPARVNWMSLAPEIATINSNGTVVAVGAGTGLIHASLDGRFAVASVIVLRPTSIGESDALIVEAFSIIEFQYPNVPDLWFYAPQVRVRAAPGRTVTVLLMKFSIPELPNPIKELGCGASISANIARELNGEVYGDWTFTMDNPGSRARPKDATAIISFADDQRVVAIRTVTGPIVAGSLPSTYGGDPGACFQWSLRPG